MKSPQQKAYDKCKGDYNDKVKAAVAVLLGTVWYSVKRDTYAVKKVGPMVQHPTEPSCLTDETGDAWWWPHLVPRHWNKYAILFETEEEALQHAIRWHGEKEAHYRGLAKERADAATELQERLRVLACDNAA